MGVYVLPCSLEDYEVLKKQKKTIINRAMEFNDFWKPEFKNEDITFRYNIEKGVIGIFIRTDGKYELAGENQPLEKKAVVGSLIHILEEELDQIHLKMEGEWVD